MKPFSVLILFLTTVAAAAQTATNVPTRSMSLEDCVQQALQHNFDIQIERYNPEISLYNLHGAYGGYDPVFTMSGQHNHEVTGGGLTAQQIPIPPSKSDDNTFNTGLAGLLPTGLQYDFSGNISDRYGETGTTNPIAFPFESSSGSVQVGLTQPLLKNFWIDSTRLNVLVDKNRLKYSEQGLRLQLMTTVTAVANAYYELIFARENVKVQQQALELAQTQFNQDTQRVEVGTLPPLNLKQDQAQVASSQANLIAAQSTFDTDQNALKNLLTDEYAQWHDINVLPAEELLAPVQIFNLQESWNKGMTQRPDLLQARLNVEQQGIQLKYIRNQLFPELDLIGTYGYNGVPTGNSQEYNDVFGQLVQRNQPYYMYGAQISVPLSNIGPRNQLKATKVALQQILLQQKQFEQNVMVEIDNAVKVAQSDFQSVDATRQARVYAEAALDSEQKMYEVGRVTTFDVLQLQNNLTAARSQEIRSLANYNEALANLAQQEGSTLDRHNINLQAK